jgi:hypothetical protein
METTPPPAHAGGDGGEGQEQQVVGTPSPPQLSDIEQDGGEGMKRISDIEQEDGYDADRESDAAVVQSNLTAPLLTGFF